MQRWGVVSFFLIVALLLRIEALPVFSTHIIGGVTGDVAIYLHLAKSLLREGLFSPQWFDLSILYPYGKTLAWSDNFILPSVIIGLLTLVGVSFPVAWNLLVIATSTLNGVLSYRCGVSSGLTKASSLWVGVAVQTGAFLSLHLGHPQLQPLFFLPGILLAAKEQHPFFRGFLVAMLIALSFLWGVYYGIFNALAGAAALLLTRPTIKMLMGILLGGGWLIPFLLPYQEVSEAFGGRDISESFKFSASIFSYISAPNISAWYSSLSFSSVEAQHFIGCVGLTLFLSTIIRGQSPILLGALILITTLASLGGTFHSVGSLGLVALALVAMCGGTKKEIRSEYFFFLLFLALSLGSQKGSYSFHSILSTIVPGLESLRAIGRVGVYVTFFMILIAGRGLSRLPVLFSLAALPLTFFENRLIAFPLEPWVEASTPAGHFQESGVREGIISLPFSGEISPRGEIQRWGEFAALQMRDVLRLAGNDRVLVNGYSGLQGRLTQRLASDLKKFPEEVAGRAIRRLLGVNFVFTDAANIPLWLCATQEKGKFFLQEIAFTDPVILLAPPWSQKITLTVSSGLPCFVTLKEEDRELLTLEVFPQREKRVVSLSNQSKNMVAPRRIAVEHTCTPLFLGETEVHGALWRVGVNEKPAA